MNRLPRIWDVDRIVSWIRDDRGPKFAFAHVTGPAATDKGGIAPASIWERMVIHKDLDSTLVHVVAPFKRTMANQRHHQDVAAMGPLAPRSPRLCTMTYEELLATLKELRRGDHWDIMSTAAIFNLKTFFLIEVDPDFSAQFVLALNAAVAFTASFPGEQEKASVRLATMSEEPLAPLTAHLFSVWGMATNVPTFETIRGRRELNLRLVESQGSAAHRLEIAISNVKNDKGGRCGLLLFKDTAGTSLEMESLERLGGSIYQVPGLHERELLNATFGKANGASVLHRLRDRPGRLIDDFRSVHIVVREFDRRAVFDTELQQVVLKDQLLTRPERLRQLTYVRRFNLPIERIPVYIPYRYLDVDPSLSRPLDYANTQTAGLLAALAGYQNWPEATRTGLHQWLRTQHQEAYERSLKTLKQQGLLCAQEGSFRTQLSLEGVDRELFFDLLPKVGYDARIAHLLVLPWNQYYLYIRVQVAVALMMGPSRLTTLEISPDLDKQSLRSVRSFAQMGVTGSVASCGTLWAQLGLVKACGSWSQLPEDIGEVEHLYQEFSEKVADIGTFLVRRGIETRTDVNVKNEWFLWKEEAWHGLSKDLLKVYSTQLARVVMPLSPGGEFFYLDLLSGRKMKPGPMDLHMVDWERICTNSPDHVVGFYTSLTEDPNSKDIVVNDWTWISSQAWDEWRDEIEETTGLSIEQYLRA